MGGGRLLHRHGSALGAPAQRVPCRSPIRKGMAVLHEQLAWYIGGPVLGLCVVAIRALLGERLGITGGYSAIVESVSARRLRLDWRAFVLFGVIAGAVAYGLIAGGPDFHGYGWLTTTFTGDSQFLVAPILVLAGVLIGFRGELGGGGAPGN